MSAENQVTVIVCFSDGQPSLISDSMDDSNVQSFIDPSRGAKKMRTAVTHTVGEAMDMISEHPSGEEEERLFRQLTTTLCSIIVDGSNYHESPRARDREMGLIRTELAIHLLSRGKDQVFGSGSAVINGAIEQTNARALAFVDDLLRQTGVTPSS